MSAPLTEKRSTPRLGMLDALRFVAAFSVVAFHFTARHSPAWNGPVPDAVVGVAQWTGYGRIGVNLFFVISGFVLLMSSWGKDIPSFVASRVGRLFPAYWVSVAGSIVLVLFIWPENAVFFHLHMTNTGALLNFTMVQSAFGAPNVDGVYWTLWYEARFYLLIALLMLVGMTRKRVLAFTALWPIAGTLAAQSHSSLLTTLLMPDYAPFFAGGMLLFLIHRDGHDLGTWLLVAMQALFGLNASMAMLPRAMVASSRWAPSSAAIALCVFACFALVALVTLTPVARWNARWMALAGALTYPIYLIHENLGWFLISRLRGSLGVWGSIVCATVAALIAAALLYYLVEKPLGPLLRRTTLAMIRSNVHPQRSDSPITVRHERSGDPRFRMPVPRPDAPVRDLPGRAMGAAQLSARSAYEPTREMPSPVS